MTLSIIVVTYNIRELARQCIRAVRAAPYDGTVEIIVVDNNSHDGTADALADEFGDLRIIRNEDNRGFAAALNQGTVASTGELVLSLNPDTIIDDQTLQVLADYLVANPQVGCVGPKILNSDGTFQAASKRSFPRPWTALTGIMGLGKLFPNSKRLGGYTLSYLDENETHIVDAVSGSCMMMPRKVMDEVGPMDETFFMWGDDLDYCYRIHKAGYQVAYFPETQIIHYKGETLRSAPYFYLRLHFRAMRKFANKHRELSGGPIARALIYLGIMLLAPFSYLRMYLATISSLLIDLAVIAIAFFGMIAIRFIPDAQFETYGMLRLYVPVVGAYALLWLSIGGLLQIYGRYVLNYSRALIASVIGFFIIATLTFIFNEIAYSRIVLIFASGIIGLLLPGWRLMVHIRQASHKVGDSFRRQRISMFSRRAIILGTGDEGDRIAKLIVKRPDMGIDLLGFVDDNPSGHDGNDLMPVLGTTSQIRELHKIHRFQEVIVAQGRISTGEIMDVLEKTRDLRLLFRMVPNEDEVMLGKANVEHIGSVPFVTVEATLYHRFHLFSKRSFDLIASGISMIMLLPFWPFLFIFLRAHRQSVWNVDGRNSRVWLFRKGSDGLRRLPLLWSIFKGDLSFVGGEVVPTDEPDPELMFKPGMTGLTQLREFTEMADVSRSYQHYYLQHQSLTFDLELILKALLKI